MSWLSKKIKHVGHGFEKIGHGAEKVGKEVGHGAEKAGKAVEKSGKSFVKGAANTVKAAAHGDLKAIAQLGLILAAGGTTAVLTQSLINGTMSTASAFGVDGAEAEIMEVGLNMMA